MSNVINYSPYTFDDSTLFSGKVAMANALMFDSLNPDELEVTVYSEATGDKKLYTVDLDWYHTVDNRGYVIASGDIRKFTYGDPILYFHDDVLVGKFYIRSVDRLNQFEFRLSAISAVGLWTNIQHMGGVYPDENGTQYTAGDIIAELLNGYTYTIDNDVANTPIYGYLPIASVRDNLQQVLFAIGASLLKDSNGDPHIKFLRGTTPLAISSDRIFIGGKLTYKTPATEIIVTEHSYYISPVDVEVSLFDNTDGSGAANHKLVTFSDPCHTLSVTDTLTIDDSGNDCGANYAYVTGTGTLTGKKYTHTTKAFSVFTGVNGEPRTATVEKATLVSAANSANVAARVRDYEATAEEVSCGIVMSDDSIKPATLVSFTDPYGEATEGFIETMDVTMSGKSKADCSIVKNYVPSHFGNNYENVAVFTADGTWDVPEGKETIRIVVGQGGQAGQNGYNGGDTETASFVHFYSYAGAGGSKGIGGEAGKVYVTDITSPTGTCTIAIGAGGTVGSGEGALGNLGGHSTVVLGGTTYTSADGAVPPEGYVDILHNISYATNGIDGIDGANGGGENTVQGVGGSVTYNGVTYTGGGIGADWSGNKGYAKGGSGGGAAYGANGENGGDYKVTPQGNHRGGDGGNGADASSLTYTPSFGGGGAGGCGGGGAGAEGYWYQSDIDEHGYGGSEGQGGAYSNGTAGGKGFVLIYY